MAKKSPQKIELTPEKKRRNIALLLALLLFVVIIYGVTIIKIGMTGGT